MYRGQYGEYKYWCQGVKVGGAGFHVVLNYFYWIDLQRGKQLYLINKQKSHNDFYFEYLHFSQNTLSHSRNSKNTGWDFESSASWQHPLCFSEKAMFCLQYSNKIW